jgi:predicted ATPase
MLTRIQLENFKSWRELDIELAPITMLFGTNSSGKSSVLQALLLLVQNQEKSRWKNLDFGGGVNDYVNLGSFREVVYRHELAQAVKIMLRQGASAMNDFGEFTIFSQNGNMGFGINNYLLGWLKELENNLAKGTESLHYLGPLRQHPQRSYLWSGAMPQKIEPDGENTIAVLVGADRAGSDLTGQVSKWLKEMELVDDFTTKALDNEKRFYETTVKIGSVESSILDVGFGISQVLPVITTLFFVPEGSIVLLEQPELHLHPRAQAHLADLFLHVAETRKLQLIVESHSEHLVRRLQRRIAESDHGFASPENIKMYFCQKGANGSTAQPVEVDNFGQIRNWPENFFGDITGDLEKMTIAALERSRNGH